MFCWKILFSRLDNICDKFWKKSIGNWGVYAPGKWLLTERTGVPHHKRACFGVMAEHAFFADDMNERGKRYGILHGRMLSGMEKRQWE